MIRVAPAIAKRLGRTIAESSEILVHEVDEGNYF